MVRSALTYVVSLSAALAAVVASGCGSRGATVEGTVTVDATVPAATIEKLAGMVKQK